MITVKFVRGRNKLFVIHRIFGIFSMTDSSRKPGFLLHTFTTLFFKRGAHLKYYNDQSADYTCHTGDMYVRMTW